jgi:hypothetical protein
LLTFGASSTISNLMRTMRMTSLGGSRRMGNTQLSPLMRCNS